MRIFTNRILLFLFLILLLFFIFIFFQPGMVEDDAYITFRYINNWVQGNGLVYNIGERVEGYSNFLWLVLLAPWAKSGFDLPIISEVFGLIFAVATLILLYLFSFLYRKENSYFLLIAPLLATVNLSFVNYTLLGLESHLFTFLIWLSIFLYIFEQKNRKIPFSGIILFLVAATRPEGIIIFIALAIHRVVRSITDPSARKSLLIWCLFFVVPFLLYTAWRYFYFGSIVSNIYYAKIGGDLMQRSLKGLEYITTFLGTSWGIILGITTLFGILSYSVRNRVNNDIIPIYLIIGIYLLFIIYAGGDWMDYHRFFIPIVPGFALIMQETWTVWIHRFLRYVNSTKEYQARRIKLYLILLVIGFIIIAQGDLWKVVIIRARQEANLSAYIENRIVARLKPNWNSLYVEIAKWMEQHTKNQQAAVAIPDIGIIGYKTQFRILDLYGLVTPAIAHRSGPMHGKLNYNYVLEQNPEFILVSYWRGSNLLLGSPLKDNELMRAQYDFVRVFVGSKRRKKLEVLYQRNSIPFQFRYVYDFIEHYDDATCFFYESKAKRKVPIPRFDNEAPRWRLVEPSIEQEIVKKCELGLNESLYPEEFHRFDSAAKSVLVSLPNGTTEYIYPLQVPTHAFLQFAIGIEREKWTTSSGVTFEVYIEHQNQIEKLFTAYADSRNNLAYRKWQEVSISLERYSNQKVLIRFVTLPGYGGWGNPRLVVSTGN